MKLCETCGNEIEAGAWKCPFCDTYAKASPPRRGQPTQRIATINLKADLPLVAEALRRLDVELVAARSKGAKLVRVIHGYGSGGSGGKIKDAARKRLRQLERKGQIKGLVTGEEYSEASERGRVLLKAYPTLKNSVRPDARNRGITFVEL